MGKSFYLFRSNYRRVSLGEKTQRKEKQGSSYPFGGCPLPSKNTKFCLLAEYKNGGKRQDGINDRQLAVGSEGIRSYLSVLFGDIDNIYDFISGLNKDQMGEIALKHGVSEGTLTLYLCDIGSGGAINFVYCQSRSYCPNSE